MTKSEVNLLQVRNERRYRVHVRVLQVTPTRQIQVAELRGAWIGGGGREGISIIWERKSRDGRVGTENETQTAEKREERKQRETKGTWRDKKIEKKERKKERARKKKIVRKNQE